MISGNVRSYVGEYSLNNSFASYFILYACYSRNNMCNCANMPTVGEHNGFLGPGRGYEFLKGSVKEPNISMYFFFPPITQWCSISDVLFTGGRGGQILVF